MVPEEAEGGDDSSEPQCRCGKGVFRQSHVVSVVTTVIVIIKTTCCATISPVTVAMTKEVSKPGNSNSSSVEPVQSNVRRLILLLLYH
jgi:hypothetical protein